MKDISNKMIVIEVLSHDASCARLPDNSFQCSVFADKKNSPIEITVCADSCSSEENQFTYEFRIETVGSFVAFDGM